jgi:LysM repeat protein
MRGPIVKTDLEEHAFVDLAYGEHRKRVERWLCDPTNLTRARTYQVKRGDSLVSIAHGFQGEKVLVEDGTLAVLNRIHNPNALQVGQQIKVPVDPIRTVVEKRSFLMAVYVGDTMLRLYWVGLGVNDKTPVAEFTVDEKQKNPDWYSPHGLIPFGDPKNILGKFFVKFRHEAHQGFGAHGTPMPETIGTQASDGCIRMYDADIEDFFKVVPRRTKVEIRAS